VTCVSSCPTDLTGLTGDPERTKDRGQTCTKVASSVLGARMEAYNSLVTSFYFSTFTLLLF
jgi:hypothetical protein